MASREQVHGAAGWAAGERAEAKGCDAGGAKGLADVVPFFERTAPVAGDCDGNTETLVAAGSYGFGVLWAGLTVRGGSAFFWGRTAAAGGS